MTACRSPLRVAVIGCGVMGIRRLAALPRDLFDLRIACDTEQGRLDALELGPVPTSTDWRTVVDSDVDAAIIAIPSLGKVDVACALLGAGKHVLIEKPLATSLVGAREICAAGLRSGSQVKVGFNLPYSAHLRALKDLVGAGEVGHVIRMTARYGHGGRTGYGSDWRCDPRQAGGGQLIDQGVHLVHLLQWIAGERPKAVACWPDQVYWSEGKAEDSVFAALSFPNAGPAMIDTSWVEWRNHFSLSVTCTRGRLEATGLGGPYGPQELLIERRDREGCPPDVERMNLDDAADTLVLELKDFHRSVSTNASPTIGDAIEGLDAMVVIDACYRSAATHRTIDLVAGSW